MPENDVIFVCVENAGRSQMAEAFLRRYAKNLRVASAGTRPSSHLNPIVVEAMREVGIDLQSQSPKSISNDLIRNSRTRVSMGCMDRESCPALFAGGVVDWNIADPKGKPLDEVRKIRDEIESQVKRLVESLQEA